MKTGFKLALLCGLTFLLYSCGRESQNEDLTTPAAVDAQDLSQKFDLYSVGNGLSIIRITATLPVSDTGRTYDVLFYGKDVLISCSLLDEVTGEKHAALLRPDQVQALNDVIRQELSKTTSDNERTDKLVWESCEEGRWRKEEFVINIGSHADAVAIFDWIIELSSFPTYDVLGDGNRWREIRDLNPSLGDEGRNLDHFFDIRIPKE